MNEHKPPPAAFFIGIAIAIVYFGLATAVWFEGPRQGWTGDRRIIIELGLLCALLVSLLLVKYFEAVLLWIASLKAARWFARYDAGKREHPNTADDAPEGASASRRATLLRDVLRDRHGWRWRYRDRWVVIAGDEPLVKRLAPGLASTGYAITSDTVLLYATQTAKTLDTAWLEQIRRLRRRRPVDAIVAITRNRSSANQTFDAGNLAQKLGRHDRALRWAAPAYLLNVTDFGNEPSGPDEAIGLTWSNARVGFDEIDISLRGLAGNLADAGTLRLIQDPSDRYPAEVSRHIDELRGALSNLILQTGHSSFSRNAVHGMLFAPLLKEREPVAPLSNPEAEHDEPALAPQRTIWQAVAEHSRRVHGRRVGFSLSSAAAWATTALVGLWIVGTISSGAMNRATIQTAADTVARLSTAQNRTQSALTLESLQKQLDTLEIHQRDGAPWTTRFGLNREDALFAAIWPGYENAVGRILVGPIRLKIEARLHQLASLSDAEIASGGAAQSQAAYDTLKTYLMLAKPERANAAFLKSQLIATAVPMRPLDSPLTQGTWDDLREHLITFYANHLARRVSYSAPSHTNAWWSKDVTRPVAPIARGLSSPGEGARDALRDAPSLAIIPDATLVAATRQTIIGVQGLQNSTDAIYQQILDDARPKYPPMPLATLLGDSSGSKDAPFGGTSSRGLFNTTATVPGIFTRAAWDERISKAIDDAGEQRTVARDWVLSDMQTGDTPPSTLKAELRQRYFDDYARAWQQFLNSLRWQSAATLSGTVDQLTLLGDPQRSPLIALMNVVVYQAEAGATAPSLSGALISKAQQLVGADEKDPSKRVQPQLSPLANAFGPILRLTGSDLAFATPATSKAAAQMAATGDLSLGRYLERVTAMRLKLQQIMASADPDATSRAAAQAVLQGKTSDIADSRDYASRLTASLGEQWAGLGELFQVPLDQTWQVVLQPAASSLNETWRAAIVADWARTFGGRYPFADSDNDASLPEMARFMRPDNGVIAQFVSTQLAGIVERQGDRWVPVRGDNHSALTVAPSFLAGLNKLMRVSTVLFPSGDAHVRYELRAVPTPGVTDTKFVLSGRELHYFNQKEEWTPFIWPGDALENITHIEWQTEQGGLRSALDRQGRFGLIRLLERATVTPQDSARYLVTWTPDQSLGVPLRVQLRSEAGAGPLDVLTLRHFTLPTRIFVTASAKSAPKLTSATPPPLPPAAIAAAKHAAMPLPPGAPSEVE